MESKTRLQGVVPPGLKVRGTIEGDGDLLVAGAVEGEVSLGGVLHLLRGGRLEAQIEVRRAIIDGRVEGDLLALEAIELLGGAWIEGDIKAPKLQIAEGAVVRGKVELGGLEAGPKGAQAATSAAEDGASAAGAGEGAAETEAVAAEAGEAAAGAEAVAARAGAVVRGQAAAAERPPKPELPASALAFGDRRKEILPGARRVT